MDINRLIKDYKNNLKKRKSHIKLSKAEKALLILLIIFGVATIASAIFFIFIKSELFATLYYIFNILLIVIVFLILIYQGKINKAKLISLRQKHRNKQVLSVFEALKNQNIDLTNKNVLLTVYNDLNFKSIKNTSIYSLFWDCVKNIILPLSISLVGIYAGFDGTEGIFTFITVVAFCIAFILAAIPITTSIYEILYKKKILLNEISDNIFKYIISENKHKNCKIKKIKKCNKNTRKIT